MFTLFTQVSDLWPKISTLDTNKLTMHASYNTKEVGYGPKESVFMPTHIKIKWNTTGSPHRIQSQCRRILPQWNYQRTWLFLDGPSFGGDWPHGLPQEFHLAANPQQGSPSVLSCKNELALNLESNNELAWHTHCLSFSSLAFRSVTSHTVPKFPLPNFFSTR